MNNTQIQQHEQEDVLSIVQEIAVPMPEPLRQSIGKSEPYPLDALPKIIREAVISHQRYAQQPVPLVACAALTQVSLACQGLADVARDSTLTSPCSLFFLVIANSGERKTTADKAFSKAAKSWERERLDEQKEALKKHRTQYDAWFCKRKGVKKELEKATASADEKTKYEHALYALDCEEPIPPRADRIIYSDINQQTLAVELAHNRASAALLSDEGGIIIGGNGMSHENAAGFFAFLNMMWDGSTYQRDRLTTPCSELVGRRFSLSLMMQEAVLRKLIAVDNNMSRSTGFLARILMTQPDSTCGTRLYKEAPAHDPALEAFASRITQLLNMPLSLEEGAEDGRLKPPLLHLSQEAKQLWERYFNDVECKIAAHGELSSIPDFVSKSAENAARLAGCFHVFCHGVNGEIGRENMQSGIAVAAWHLEETLRIFSQIDMPPERADALLLWEWLQKKGHAEISRSHVLTHGPNPLRKRERCDAAWKLLKEQHYLIGKERMPHRVNPRALEVEQ